MDMNRSKLIAAIVLGIFGFFIFNELSEGKIVSLLNDSFYYIFLFIFILIAGVLGIGLAIFALYICISFAVIGGFIYFLIVGEYFFAFVWFIVGSLIVSFLSGDFIQETKKKSRRY